MEDKADSGADSGGASGAVAVIFTSRLSGDDPAGYADAAAAMERLAAAQPGYLGLHAARGADGVGITVSHWADEAAAIAWRDQSDHQRVREAGRRRWYDWYDVTVARVLRRYAGGSGRDGDAA